MTTQSLTKQTLKIFWQHSRKYKLFVLLSVTGIILASLFELYQPILYKDFFDLLAQKSAAPNELFKIVVYIFIVAWFEWLFWRLATFSTAYFQSKTKQDIQTTCFNYLHKHSMNFFGNNFVGSLVRKANRYDQSFESLADLLFWNVGNTLFKVIAIIIIISFFYPILGLIILIFALIYLSVIFYLNEKILKHRIARAAADTETTGYLADTVSNNINLKIFSSQNLEEKGYQKLTEKLHQLRIKVWNYALSIESVQGALMISLEFVILIFALNLWEKGEITIGGFVLINSYLFVIFRRLWELGRHSVKLYEHIADANEMTEILLTPHSVKDKQDAKTFKIKKGEIEFKDVTFGYHETLEVLTNFNFKISPGEKVALIGPSGGGKSTIVKLIFRFMDIHKGEILIDGQNISQVTQDSLRENISLVPQEPILFHRSLMENIRYGKPSATNKEVVEAAKKAHAHEFITSFPTGYETLVGERGIKLSGGERQRVAIARAILKNAPILVLDEATSSLDSESEHYIQEALKTLMANKTTIVIAHRLSTIMQMDRIVVLENGKITEQGKHEELVKAKQGTYQRLWEIQAGGFA
jgi:ATP-binding cassette subfamily B protein